MPRIARSIKAELIGSVSGTYSDPDYPTISDSEVENDNWNYSSSNTLVSDYTLGSDDNWSLTQNVDSVAGGGSDSVSWSDVETGGVNDPITWSESGNSSAGYQGAVTASITTGGSTVTAGSVTGSDSATGFDTVTSAYDYPYAYGSVTSSDSWTQDYAGGGSVSVSGDETVVYYP